MNVGFIRNGQLVSGSDAGDIKSSVEEEKKSVPAGPQKVARDTEKPNFRFNTRAVDHAGEDSADSIVPNLIHLVRSGGIPIDRAASMIAGRIRFLFVSGIRKEEDQTLEFDAESFRYLDQLIFDPLSYLIESTIRFGSRNSIPLNNITKMIIDSAKIVDYRVPQPDLDKIRGILVEVYRAF